MPFSVQDVAKIAAKEVRCDVVCSSDEDKTRQEFREECDVNHILRQHSFVPRPVQFGEHNFDSDLTQQMQSRSVFLAWYESAPENVREQYPDLASFLAAFGAGAIKTGSEAPEVPSGDSSPSASPAEPGALG